jgi:hypothetical protein
LRLQEEGVRILIGAALVFFLAVFAVYMWLMNLLTQQREFGVLLAAELLAFSMLVYLSTKPDLGEVKKSWLLAGCVGLALFLTLALL